MRRFYKDKNALLDYGWDWSAWLGADVIASAQVAVEPNDGSLRVERTDLSPKMVVVWLSGGRVGEVYRVTCRVVTAEGRVDDRSFLLEVIEQ